MAAPQPPIILTPYPVPNFSSNKQEQVIGGVAAPGTVRVSVLQRPEIVVTLNTTTLEFSFSTILTEGSNSFSLVGESSLSEKSPPATLEIVLTTDDQLSLVVGPPTGISVASTKDAVIIRWLGTEDDEVLGYNLRSSDQPAGGLSGYALLNLIPITNPIKVEEQRQEVSREKTKEGDLETELVKYRLVPQSFFELKDSKRKSDGGIDRRDFFYVLTSVKFDPILRQEVESVFSSELSAAVIPITQQINKMPRSTSREVLVRLINTIYQAQPLLDVKTGTVARDLLDPSSEEFEDVYLLLDFMHRSQSMVTLLQIDDANDDAVSDDPASNEYKQSLKKALHLTEDTDVQQVIDTSFTVLASTFGVERTPSSPSRVDVTFYTTSEPRENLVVSVGDVLATKPDTAVGIPEVRYRVLESKTLPFDTRDQFFNLTKSRWEIVVPVEAETPGAVGNVAAGSITRIVSGAAGFRVENLQGAGLGEDEETNRELAERTLLQLIGIDTGTKNGYLRKTLGVVGVKDARVVAAGDYLMFRDWDEVRNKHIGGKVDIYVQADQFSEAVERVPFSFALNQARKAKVQSAPLMQFLVEDEIFNQPGNDIYKVVRIRNLTRAKTYDLTGVTIVPPNLIVLDNTNTTNLIIGLSNRDLIEVTFDRLQIQTFILQNQPVREIKSVVGDLSGDLNNNYNLYKDADPLLEGRSSASVDRVEIFSLNGLPKPELPPLTEDTIRLSAEFRRPLSKVGVDLRTVKVLSTDLLLEYTRGVDFELETEETTPYVTNIYRLITGSILDGTEVIVRYQTGENVQITYVYNQSVDLIAQEIDKFRHVTADVVVKESNKISIDLVMTVGLKPGADKELIDPKIRSVIRAAMDGRRIGQSVYQSDVIGWVEAVEGVDFVVVPLSTMVRANHTLVTAEKLEFPQSQDEAWQVYALGKTTAWISKFLVLTFATEDGGGLIFQPDGRPNKLFRHVAVYQDSQPLTAQSDPRQVAEGQGRCFIRADRKVIISTLDGSQPGPHFYHASYFVLGERGAKDIIMNDMEYPALGQLVITFQEFSSGG